jgi:chloramphenicol 3-O phosphotransferase
VVDDGRAAALFQALLDARSPDALAMQLEPLRGSTAVEVEWLAVNGDRVDIVARAGDREWRVVFGTADGDRVDWLRVFERPAALVGVEGGRAVIVNGPSSSGKSTVLAALRQRSTMPWVVFDEPMFGDVDVAYLIWREQAPALHRGFLDGIAALARAGNVVALAAGGHPQAMFDAAFAGVPTIRVGLDCDLAELARRERGRRDIPGGWAEASLDVHDGWQYDLRFDTGQVDSAAIADAVLDLLGS